MRVPLAVCFVAASLLSAEAQSPPTTPATPTPPQANTGPGNNAVNAPNTNNPGAPIAGANSFTEAQAKSRLEGLGFSAVSGLKKDDSGVWRASATKDGKSQNVGLDFQGNVVTQ